MIVGTSMDSFVGGLYASGVSPQEMEEMLTSTDWKEYIKTDYNRQDMPMRRKAVDYHYYRVLLIRNYTLVGLEEVLQLEHTMNLK